MVEVQGKAGTTTQKKEKDSYLKKGVKACNSE